MLHPYGNLTCIWQQYWAKIAFWVQNKTYNVVHFTYNGFNKIHWPSLHTYNIFLFPDRHDLILSFKWLKDICLVKGFINKQVQPVFADYTFDVLSCWIPLRYILCNSLNGLPRSNPCIPAATLEKDMDLSYNISYGKGAMLSSNHVQKMWDLKHLVSQQYSNFIPNNYLIVKARKSANKGCCCCCRQLSRVQSISDRIFKSSHKVYITSVWNDLPNKGNLLWSKKTWHCLHNIHLHACMNYSSLHVQICSD